MKGVWPARPGPGLHLAGGRILNQAAVVGDRSGASTWRVADRGRVDLSTV